MIRKRQNVIDNSDGIIKDELWFRGSSVFFDIHIMHKSARYFFPGLPDKEPPVLSHHFSESPQAVR